MNVGIIQARLNSQRLPGKVLMDLGGKSVLAHVVERVRAVQSLNEIIVATTYANGGGAIAGHCEALGVECFQWDGPQDDVLDRFVACLRKHPATNVLRVCADNPLLDSQSCDALIAELVESRADYCGYLLPKQIPAITKPTGYFAEAVTADALQRANSILRPDAPQREHVTACMYQEGFITHDGRRDLFRVHWLHVPVWWKKETLKYVAIDTLEDLERIREAMTCGAT